MPKQQSLRPHQFRHALKGYCEEYWPRVPDYFKLVEMEGSVPRQSLQLWLNGTTPGAEPAEIRELLGKKLRNINEPFPLVVLAEPSVRGDQIFAVVEAARDAGLREIHFVGQSKTMRQLPPYEDAGFAARLRPLDGEGGTVSRQHEVQDQLQRLDLRCPGLAQATAAVSAVDRCMEPLKVLIRHTRQCPKEDRGQILTSIQVRFRPPERLFRTRVTQIGNEDGNVFDVRADDTWEAIAQRLLRAGPSTHWRLVP